MLHKVFNDFNLLEAVIVVISFVLYINFQHFSAQ
jgi:hypothetical protein